MDSFAAGPNFIQITEAQRAELSRRIAEDDAAAEEVIPWEQVKAEALARLDSRKS